MIARPKHILDFFRKYSRARNAHWRNQAKQKSHTHKHKNRAHPRAERRFLATNRFRAKFNLWNPEQLES